MGTQSVAAYCREIETYLCRKNDGHLIRVAGPSFELVSGWAARGIPLKIAFAGIDRYFERYYRMGPRRRPVRIDFCEADVLDLFDEWRRAVGVPETSLDRLGRGSPPLTKFTKFSGGTHRSTVDSRESLPAHLERALARLTSARARGAVGSDFDALIDRVAAELDATRAEPGGVRGVARKALIERLGGLDAEILDRAREGLDRATLDELGRAADAELAPFRAAMTSDAVARARQAAIDRLIRERFSLPTVAFR